MLYELNLLSIIVRVVLSLFIGGILGIERGSKRHPAGFRTYMLVCLGSTMVMMTNHFIVQEFGGSDPARLGAQVISGIGFLGAGTIMVTQRQQVKGLTTAASLWTAACLGLAIGIGFYQGAIIVGITVLLIMTALRRLDSWLLSNTYYLHIYAGFESMKYFNSFIEYCHIHGIAIKDIEMTKSKVSKDKGVFAILILKNRSKESHTGLLDKIKSVNGLLHIEEL